MRAVLEERHGQGHRGGAEEEMHELRAVEVRLVGRARRGEHRDQHGHCDEHRVEQRTPPESAEDPRAGLVRGERRGQPEQRRRAQVDPDARDHRVLFSSARATAAKTSALTAIVAAVLMTIATVIAASSARTRPAWRMSPTPAGTNSSER